MKNHPRQSAPGTQPQGTTDEASASRYVRRLFSDIAPRYDLLNHLLSFQVDRYWRSVTTRQFRHLLSNPAARVLDLCCGTADLSMALARRGNAQVIASDFSHPMLTIAQHKLNAKPRQDGPPPLLAEADALQLPFPGDSFDLVTCAFGFRNLVNYGAGLKEIWRVLRTGGEVGILEFAEPTGPLMAPLYSFYLHRVLPAIGEWVSGVRGSYSYLPGSVDRFPAKEEFTEQMRVIGFSGSGRRELTWGIAVLYTGKKTAR
ncbi:MAG: ubiquinone/menaquinone biosynthesis methyltransferase [Acidobacteriota bacterium]